MRAWLLRTATPSRQALLQIKLDRYGRTKSRAEIEAYQLSRLQDVWDRARKGIRFYEKLYSDHRLPSRIDSLDQLRDFPVLDKPLLQRYRALITGQFAGFPTVVTGGSTGRPTTFITGRSEKNEEWANTYLGRHWNGVKPFDSTVLFWGHSHIFGQGWRGQLNQLKRQLYDRILNITRLDAYNLSPETIEDYFARLLRARPSFVVGYTSLVFMMARAILDKGWKEVARGLSLRCVIVTSETVTDIERAVISEAFGCRVAVEYGMAETSVLSYTSADSADRMDLFWDSYIAYTGEAGNLIVTSIYDRNFPLINYDTNDTVEALDENSRVLSFTNVKGRSKDNVSVRRKNGGAKELSGILLVHILKSRSGIYSIQYAQLPGDEVRISLLADAPLSLAEVHSYFARELNNDHPDVDAGAVLFEQVWELKRTVAGKNRLKLDISP
jgi:phenylacetate-coenzyme A ligase PaaK-like adenylate-forming protein